MRTLLILLLVGLAAQTERVVPVHQEPRHRMVFETPGTRVLDIQIAPGDTTLFHTHSDPILYVTLSTSRTRGEDLRAATAGASAAPSTSAASGTPIAPSAQKVPTAPSTPPGRMMSTTTYADTPLTHRVTNVGETLFRLIGVTNASGGDPNDAPSADFGIAPEITNRWFRGYRYTLNRDESREHRHANPVAIVLASGGMALENPAASSSPLTREGPGFVGFVEANREHTIRATSGETHIIEIELRRPALPALPAPN